MDTESSEHCADAQADLGLRCPHLPGDTVSHVAAHLKKKLSENDQKQFCGCSGVGWSLCGLAATRCRALQFFVLLVVLLF